MDIETERWISKPRNLFLVDGLGAMTSALFLVIIRELLHDYVGMPVHVLTALAAVAAILCLYSLTCFFAVKERWKRFLRLIAITNILYCLATIACMIWFRQSLKVPGIIYFIGEIMVILMVVKLELSAIGRPEKSITQSSK